MNIYYLEEKLHLEKLYLFLFFKTHDSLQIKKKCLKHFKAYRWKLSATLSDIFLVFLPSSYSNLTPLEALTPFHSVITIFSNSDLILGFYTLFNLWAPLDFQILR